MRIGLIERERTLPLPVLFARVDGGLHDWELRLATLTPADLERVGRHQLRGDMRVADMLEPFCLGHAEGHVEQIDDDPGGVRAVGSAAMFILYAIPIGIVAGFLLGGRLDRLGDLRLRWALAGGGRPRRPAPAVRGPDRHLGRGLRAADLRPVDRGRARRGGAQLAHPRDVAGRPRARPRTCWRSWPTAGSCRPRRRRSVALEPVGGAGFSNSVVVADPALRPLTDIFALPAWLPFANVFSIGDVLIGVGIAVVIALAMRRDVASGRAAGDVRLTTTVADAATSIGATWSSSRTSAPACPEVVLRTAVVYLFLVVVLRISGKREVGQLSVLELVVILVISDAVQNSMVGENTTLWGGLVAVLTLLGLDCALKWAVGRSRRLRGVVEGEPRLLVRDGKLLEKALREEGVDAEEVRRAVRRQGLARVEDVRLAVLETDGTISVIPKDD